MSTRRVGRRPGVQGDARGHGEQRKGEGQDLLGRGGRAVFELI